MNKINYLDGIEPPECSKCNTKIACDDYCAGDMINAYNKGASTAIDKLVEELNNIFEWRHDMRTVRNIAEHLKENLL